MKTAAATFESGRVRVQVLGPHLVRVEEKGPKGFEDRETFTVRHRAAAAVEVESRREGDDWIVATADWRVVVPDNTHGVEGVRIENRKNETLCTLSNAMRRPTDLPAPSSLPTVWVLGDSPRVVPPPWGALPPPEGEESATSGWDLSNDGPDLYVFFPAAAGYERFRKDFLELTGPVPQVPLYALGLWYSRYHPYSDRRALEIIDRFRTEHIPLDVFVVDTDWRVGASCGYAVNETLFPDMAEFTREAHARNVRVMLNDHPEPKGAAALDPVELRYRRDGLRSLLDKGVDLWWFDRNWHTHLQSPAPGLEKEVWGMCLYHAVAKEHDPERRSLILSNVDGIDNGWRTWPSHPAAHRYPVWWTGDTCAEWRYLRAGVINGVESGIRSLLPYVHEDLGGHHGQPDEELYVRFLQYGAFCPVARLHCTTNVHRYPWEYGPNASRIVGDFFRLRYRLLPMLYAASVQIHETGAPLMRRGDLEWPEQPEAADNTQYLLGDDLLVAPVTAPARAGHGAERTVWIPPGEWQDVWTGRIFNGPALVGREYALNEYPLFLRRGGVLLSIPPRESTGAAIWPELTADALVPGRDGRQTRLLVEDDGWSVAAERDGSARTKFTLAREETRAVLEIQPDSGKGSIRPEKRDWVLRLHLPPGAQVAGAEMNGRELAGEDYAVRMPEEGPSLLAGAGMAPPAGAGPVAEWRGSCDPNVPLRFAVRWAED